MLINQANPGFETRWTPSLKDRYFRLFPGTIKGPQIVEFLKALRAQIKRKLLIVWDGLGVHKSSLVRAYVESLKGKIQIEFLPAYAPELNPTEYIWGHLKQHEMADEGHD